MTTFSMAASRPKSRAKANAKHRWIFVVLLQNGKLVVGSANNASRSIAAVNSGYYKEVPNAYSIHRIIGVKAVTEERTLDSVVAKLSTRFGSNKIIKLN